MADHPQFQQIPPQFLPMYLPQLPPTTFPIAEQPIFQTPTNFAYTPVTWTQIPQFPQPTPSQNSHVAYNASEEDNNYNLLQQHSTYNNNNENATLNEQWPRHTTRNKNHRNEAKKFDTRHEEYRKYLEEMGILSILNNILCEMYENPLRPKDPLEFIRDKLHCSQPETVELSNLRLWCAQYQAKTVCLKKELKDVIERLRKYEPYNVDESLFDNISSENECKSCVLDTVNQEDKLENNEESTNRASVSNSG